MAQNGNPLVALTPPTVSALPKQLRAVTSRSTLPSLAPPANQLPWPSPRCTKKSRPRSLASMLAVGSCTGSRRCRLRRGHSRSHSRTFFYSGNVGGCFAAGSICQSCLTTSGRL